MNMYSPISEKKQAPDWSAGDVNLLSLLWSEGVHAKEIARRMGRTAAAINQKRIRLKLGKRRAGNLEIYQAFYASPALAEKIRINANALGINKAEYIRRACERCPVEAIAE